MSQDTKPLAALPAGFESLIAELHQKSGADEYGLGRDEFHVIVAEIAARYVPQAPPSEVRAFCASLRVEELALARACANGHEKAWEKFMVRYRAKLYEAAGYIAKESSAARELADSLYADLYGTTTREGARVSKLASFTGRGSLEGWLRTVLAQEYVNRYRRQRRLVSLEEESESGMQFAAAEAEPTTPVDQRLGAAVDRAIGSLSPEDRFVLASYYLDERTLADIGRTLAVHESTISRKLDKLAKSLRKQILTALRDSGMSRRQAEEALDVDVRDLGLNLRNRLAQENAGQAFLEKKVKTPAGEQPG